MHFFFSFYFRYIISCILWSCDRFDIHCTYIPFILMYVFLSPILTMCCFFSFLIHMFLILVCNLLFLFHTKMP